MPVPDCDLVKKTQINGMQNAGLHATAPIQVTPAAAVLRGGGLQKHLGSFFQGESPVTDPNALTNILTTRG